MHKINKTAVAFLRRYATLFIKKTQYLLSRLRMNSLWRRTILNGLRLRSGHVQRKKYFKFCVCRALRSAPNAIFTEGVVKASGICSAAAGKFLVKPQGLRERSLPLGGAVAQRLRGYEWRSEKSVKAIAPTGAALAFLCFDFFFRIVKGVQPLACCGVGGVQR